jgi:hypothetical protein
MEDLATPRRDGACSAGRDVDQLLSRWRLSFVVSLTELGCVQATSALRIRRIEFDRHNRCFGLRHHYDGSPRWIDSAFIDDVLDVGWRDDPGKDTCGTHAIAGRLDQPGFHDYECRLEYRVGIQVHPGTYSWFLVPGIRSLVGSGSEWLTCNQ